MHSTQNKYGYPGINMKIEFLFYVKTPVLSILVKEPMNLSQIDKMKLMKELKGYEDRF